MFGKGHRGLVELFLNPFSLEPCPLAGRLYGWAEGLVLVDIRSSYSFACNACQGKPFTGASVPCLVLHGRASRCFAGGSGGKLGPTG